MINTITTTVGLMGRSAPKQIVPMQSPTYEVWDIVCCIYRIVPTKYMAAKRHTSAKL